MPRIGEKEENYMSKKIKYEANPFGKNIKIGDAIVDFLPSPDELCRKVDAALIYAQTLSCID